MVKISIIFLLLIYFCLQYIKRKELIFILENPNGKKLDEWQIETILQDELDYLLKQEMEQNAEIDPITISSLQYLIQLFHKSNLSGDSKKNNNPSSPLNIQQAQTQREQKIKQLQKVLDILFEQTLESSSSDANTISSLLHLMNVYCEKTSPEGFGAEEFLSRFYERLSQEKISQENVSQKKKFHGNDSHEIHSQEIHSHEINSQEIDSHKDFIPWYKSDDPKLKFLKRKAYLTSFLFMLFSISVFHHSIYVEGKKEVYRVQKYAEDSILFQKRNFNLFQHPLQTSNQLEKPIHSIKIPEKYRGTIYLPINLLNNSLDYQFYEMENSIKKELIIKIVFDDITQWMDLLIETTSSILEINYNLGDSNILKDEFCCWNNAHIYFNEQTKITNILFEIGSDFYSVTSNIPIEELIEIVNQMEVYK